MDTLGSRIKKRREELGMSQQQLSTKVGFASRTSINKIESDVRSLPADKIEAVAKALYMTPSELMGWEHDSTNEFIQSFKKLDESDKNVISMMIKTLLSQEKYGIKRDSSAS